MGVKYVGGRDGDKGYMAWRYGVKDGAVLRDREKGGTGWRMEGIG